MEETCIKQLILYYILYFKIFGTKSAKNTTSIIYATNNVCMYI